MLKQTITDALKAVYERLPKETIDEKGDGWVNLANFAPELKREGVDYKRLGYEKLGDLIYESGQFSSILVPVAGKTVPARFVRFKSRRPRIGQPVQNTTISISPEDVNSIKRRLRLSNNQFIGQFSPQQTDGWYKITDIRNTDFTKIEDKERGIKDLSISFKSSEREFNKFAYYKFTWTLLGTYPLKFGINLREEITPVWPKDIVSCLYESIMNYPASAAKKIERSLDTLKKQLTQSGKEVFIYELLQNANDYPRRARIDGQSVAMPVEVEFHITRSFLTFQHTGDYFNPKNIAAICDINDGEKSDNTEAIGYKGIGFKTVFLDNDYVYLNTGNYSFRFDKSATDVIHTPWQILPIWTDNKDVDYDIKQIFREHPNEEFRVKFALQPRDRGILTDESRGDNYIDLFKNVFDSERVILFIPNIKKVSIVVEGEDRPIVREKDSNDWCVSEPLVDDIPEEITAKINDVLNNPDSLRSDGYEKIPEKYVNFRKTTVKFACKKEGRKLLPVDDAILYCYLPAKRADWGFNFLMNTDMVPNGQRDDIEDIELNHEIAKIAGRQFFYWIKQLIESQEYELDSIFSLIPNFEECKKRRIYKDFIEEFQTEFEALIKEEAFVPVVDKDGNSTYKCIDEIIDDRTGLTANEIISDKDFLALIELEEEYLPISELRQSDSFMEFLYHHSPANMDIDVDDIIRHCESEDFKSWLSEQEQNSRFIKHWLDRNELKKFSGKTIFIEYEGELFAAEDMYYDFDENCKGIEFLRKFIPHLNPASRAELESADGWESFVDESFMDFEAAAMIEDYLLDNENALKLLEEPSNSVAFYSYLADNDVDLKSKKSEVPYINIQGQACKEYSGLLYFCNQDSAELSEMTWVSDDDVRVLSGIYFDNIGEDESDNLKKLFSKFGFKDFDKESFISSVIAGDSSFRENVNTIIDDDIDASKSFVNYIFESGAQLKEMSLKDYVLCCIDINGKEIFLCNDDVRYFNQEAYSQNSSYSDNISHPWLSDKMMYALSNAYFNDYNDEQSKKLESFLRQQFGIKTFTDKSFFVDVVLKNRAAIYDGIKDESSLMTFISYMKRDASRIFDDSISFGNIKDMPLLCYDGSVLKSRQSDVNIYEYDEDAIELYEKEWCPGSFVIVSKIYSDDFSPYMRQLFRITKYDVNSALTGVFTSADFSGGISDTEQNIDFWRWVKKNQKQIESFDALQGIKLLDKDDNLEIGSSLYISDTYQQDKIETLVTRYVQSARFVSPSYAESDDESEKSGWLKLFKKIGLKSDNKDILFSDILPNLSSFEEDSVISMMTKHLKDLKEEWNDRRSQIIKLRVRTQSGKYKTIDQVILVDVEEESTVEPFKYITLSDEVAPEVLKANKELLHLISEEYNKLGLITTKQGWINAKIEEYISQFKSDQHSIDDIHIQFVRELAKIQNEYNVNNNLKEQIQYRSSGDEIIYKSPKDLTLGTAYSPICDFEANGVTELSYISNEYIFEGNKDSIKTYFKGEGIHQDILREDLKFLSIRAFACYFWSYCFSRRISEYEDWIEEGLFDNLVCIPTQISVKTPESLYSPRMTAGYAVRAKVPQWEDKVPYKGIVDKIESRNARELFEKLHFSEKLSFEDCLYYLSHVNDKREEESDYRRNIVNWMLSSSDINDGLVESYRALPTATWRNGKGQKKHISELYAIHPDATQERNIFWGDEYIMQTTSFPSSIESFVKVCDILHIKYLTSSDFVATPVNKKDETADMIAILRPRLLVLAAIENPDKFQQQYERYNEKLTQYQFYVCENIDLGYDTVHNDVMRIYNDDTHIYYVNSWLHNRTFTKFCGRLRNLVGCYVDSDVCEDVLDTSNTVEDCIEKYCSSLTYSQQFQSYLKSLDLTVNTPVEIEEEPVTGPEDYYSEAGEEQITETFGKTVTSSLDNEVEAVTDSASTNVEDTTVEKKLQQETYCTALGSAVGSETKISVQETADSGDIGRDNQPANEPAEDKRNPACMKEAPTVDDSYEQTTEELDDYGDDIVEDEYEEEDSTDYGDESEETAVETVRTSPKPKSKEFDPDRGKTMGSIRNDKDYQPLGDRPHSPRVRRHPKPFTNDEINRMRSNGTPLELESLPPTKEEIDLLAQCNISPEQIADTNYLAQLRLYLNLVHEHNEEPEETMSDFVHNADDVTSHKMKDGRYIHTCSAARGVMYISPSVWNKMVDDKWKICVYLDGQGKNFHYINNAEEFIKLVVKDDIVIKITGKEKTDVVKTLYSGILNGVKGTAYTLVRVAARTNMDAVFAHYIGAMAETEDGNDDPNDY